MRCVPALIILAMACSATGEPVSEELSTAINGRTLYDHSQLYNLMRGPRGESIVLNDLVLLENDGPGAGFSEKGAFMEPLHEGVRAKKLIPLDDARAKAAHLVIYLDPEAGQDSAPYYVLVNGQRVEGIPVPWHEGRWHWVPIPVELLFEGANEFVVACDAPAGKGYNLLFARADEYAMGGGPYTVNGNTALVSAGIVTVPDGPLPDGMARIDVGKTSQRSTDGGVTWTQGTLGGEEQVRGEYAMRLHLERYQRDGVLVSAPIDLWAGAGGEGLLVPSCTVERVVIRPDQSASGVTSLAWTARFSATGDAEGSDWTPFAALPADGVIADVPDGSRFVQLRTEFQTLSPMSSPSVSGLGVDRTVRYAPVPEKTFFVRSSENPETLWPSIPLRFEPYGTPELGFLRERLGVEGVLAGTESEFEAINKLRHHVSQQWYHGSPLPTYPAWNGLEILDRRDAVGKGGMCQQFTILFMQALASLGHPARHVNMFAHESHEVFVASLGKWVVVDPESVFDSYEYNTETGEPISAMEQHEYFLKEFGFTKDKIIPWMSPEPFCTFPQGDAPGTPQPLAISTFTSHINNPDPALRPPQHRLGGFLRIIPRNDFLSHPGPRPLSNGSTHWPWDGYLCWYDEATPRKLQYALHTDRLADFSPTMGRVSFVAAHTGNEGKVRIQMTTLTPNFEAYEVRFNDGSWTDSPATFEWALRPSGLNRVEMRTRNAFGVRGLPSHAEVLWHYRAPYAPRVVETAAAAG